MLFHSEICPANDQSIGLIFVSLFPFAGSRTYVQLLLDANEMLQPLPVVAVLVP